MPDFASSDGPPPLTTEALATACAALVAFAAGPYDDAGIIDAATLAADAAIYLDTAARKGGLTSVSTISTVTTCLAMTASELSRLLPWARDWLSAELTAGRVTADLPLHDLDGRAREAWAGAAECASNLDGACRVARELTRAMIDPGPDFTDDVPYDDLDTMHAAGHGLDAAHYLAEAVQGGGVTGPATLAGLTAGLATASSPVASLLAWFEDWLSAELTAGRVIGEQPLPELAVDARTTLETAAARAAGLARALQAAHDLTAALRLDGETAGPVTPAAAPPAGARGPKPLLPRDQLSEDVIIAVGPVLMVGTILRSFQEARVVHGPWDLWTVACLAGVPLAVFLFHRTAAPQPSPPATTARRVLTWAAAAVTAVLAAACVAADCALLTRHALDWWFLLQPVIVIVPLLTASTAIRRNRPAPRNCQP
jgi:hypothetical protein